METIVTINAPKKAGANPSTLKPLIKLAAQNTIPFTISIKKPKVTILNGKVKTFKTTPKVEFKMPRIIATNTAVQNPATVIPGTIFAASITAKALMMMRDNKNMDILYHRMSYGNDNVLVPEFKTDCTTLE